ncbi:MAG: hypothetical protein RL014_609 [Pseudomonadota bacterium]|jgi:methanogenic corrinoid protein MtbC1
MAVPAPSREQEISRTEVLAFCELILTDSGMHLALAHVHRLLEHGVSMRRIYAELMTPAARELGAGWDTDRWDFSQVSHGLLVLQSLLQDLSAEWRAGHHEAPDARRILLMPVPGSQHTFGLLMIAELFRLEGWSVWAEPVPSVREVVELVRNRWFDVVGFSIGTQAQANSARSAILLVRKQSSNRRVKVMVGGPAIHADPSLGKWLYADMIAGDGTTAVAVAEQLAAESRQLLPEPN